jgi:uncharacterized protein YdeI (BOF family)
MTRGDQIGMTIIAVSVAVALMFMGAFFQAGCDASARNADAKKKAYKEREYSAMKNARFGIGDRVVILVGRVEGQVVDRRYDDESGEVLYQVKFQKWVRAEGPIIERAEPTEEWFRGFELVSPDDAPPHYSPWFDSDRSGRREFDEAPPGAVALPAETDNSIAPKPAE